ncbi:hypothetical protein BDV3_006985 [Batrachochytrium dendrobatidis]|nr:hypothetical protein QVD99_007666 [Batrachochytrium dendrobatidis]OAJ42935.1 hypothetical protein BDEG_26324 [Batrachochytrium dendrobatidis JEL423]
MSNINAIPGSAHEALITTVDSQIDSFLSSMRLMIAAASSTASSTTSTTADSSTNSRYTFLAAQESLVAGAATANMARSIEHLLSITTKLKQTLVLSDFAALNQQILPRHRTLTNQSSLCRDTLMEMRDHLIRVHQILVDALYSQQSNLHPVDSS